MIPLKLEFQAFGSYVKRQSIDFTKFSQGEIFLIDGKTGSGKTTIIDAMVFALYGKGSGDGRNDIEKMRSHTYGAENIPTEVSFTFETGGKTYKFERRCSRRVKNKRDGTQEVCFDKEQNAFELLDGVFTPIYQNPKVKEIDDLAVKLIGLDHEQFTKVIVLPQGQFESFLVASSKEKEDILTTLFDVEKWGRAADFLCDNGKKLCNTAKELSIKCNEKLERYDCKDITELEALKEEQVNRISEVNAQLELVEKELESLTKQKEKQSADNKKIEEYETAKNNYNALASQKGQFENLEKEIEKNRVFLEIEPYRDFCIGYNKEVKVRESALSEAEKAIEAGRKILAEKKDRLEEISSRQEKILQLEEKSKGMESCREKLGFKDEIAKSVKDLAAQNVICEERLASLSEKQKLLKSEQEECALQLKTATQQIAQLPTLSEKMRNISETENLNKILGKIAKEKNEKESEISKIKEEISAQKGIFGEVKAKYSEKQEAYMENLASNLAAELSEGSPCPVCGSIHHPNIAKIPENSASKEEIEAISEQLEELRKAISELEKKLAAGEGQLCSLNEKYSENHEKYEKLERYSDEERKKIEKDFKISKKASENISGLNKLSEQLKSDASECENSVNSAKNMLNENEKALAAAEAEFRAVSGEIEKILPADVKTVAQLDEKLGEIAKIVSDYNKEKEEAESGFGEAKEKLIKSESDRKSAEDELLLAKEKYERSVSDYKNIMKKNGLSDRSEYENFGATKEEIVLKEKKLLDYRSKLAAAGNSYQQLAEETKEMKFADITAISEQINALKKSETDTVSEKAALENTNKAIADDIKLYNETFADYEKLNEEGNRLMRFGREVRGDNGVGLRRFVLKVMLDRVLFEANNSLKRFKGGEFAFVINEEKQGREHHHGLEIDVISNKGEAPYSAKNLSGGEKFLGAMCLSMALSSIVQMFAGGIKIDALFIDEGFGTLDNERLEEAMQVLLTMAKDKKIVGIISHVDMLKEAITRKINVSSDASGSHLSVNF